MQSASMKFSVTHLTRYQYEQAVAFSPHALYLRPRETPQHRVSRFAFNIAPSFKLTHTRDTYDNNLTWLHLWDRSDALSIRTEFEVETLETTPFDFILRTDTAKFPFNYTPAEQLALTPYLATPFDSHHSTLRNWLDEHFIARPPETIPFLTGLNTVLYCHLDYKRREGPGVQSPLTTLELRTGHFRDYATLLVEMCRALGFAARFVSGYFHTYPEDNRVSTGAMHAWAEVYIPGAGWKGLDPTHGIFTTAAYIPLAHAPRAEEVSPIQGSFFSTVPVPSQLTTKLIIERIE
jgi:transglutaminase-like putative cysteine protease